MWALPFTLDLGNNYTRKHYVVGTVDGIFNTFDLAAAKAKVIKIDAAYKPIYSDKPEHLRIHEKYAKILLGRIDNTLSADDKLKAKPALNGYGGKLGAGKPVAPTSNFFAYSMHTAHSHYTMSRLFDMCKTPILGTDTDSIFTTGEMSGFKFNVTDGKYTVPIELANKGYGDLALFRSKLYMLFTKEQQERLAKGIEIMRTDPVFARHAWVYWFEDFFKLFAGNVTNMQTRRDIKHTMATRTKEALEIIKGGWLTTLEDVDITKLDTLHADTKRVRETNDSYRLIQSRKAVSSRAWAYGELLINHELIALDKVPDFDEEY